MTLAVGSRKTCCRCKTTRHASKFYSHGATTDRLRPECKSCTSVTYKKWRHRNRAYLRRTKHLWLVRNNAEILKRRKATRDSTRRATLDLLGGACACCEERRFEFLAIDHINGNGRRERMRGIAGHKLCRRILSMDHPERTYQVLCHNCNMAKAFYGECPHKKGK